MTRLAAKILFLSILFLTAVQGLFAYNPFVTQVIDYNSAPGVWADIEEYSNPDKVIGPPCGGGAYTPNNSSVVSLGGFGGSITLAFDHDVKDDPTNPMGLDAIVFSNAQYASMSPQLHWAEFATIEIMPELSGDNIPGNAPGEKWYVIAGSHLIENNRQTKTWEDADPTSSFILYPNYLPYGRVIAVQNPNLEDSNSSNDNNEGYWGYAEYTPTLALNDNDPNLFYTGPDDPFQVGISAGSGGGDAFDIAWAVDQETWKKAHIKSFRYIRLVTAVDMDLGSLNEVSAEIDAVADVRSVLDLDGNGTIDYSEMAYFISTWQSTSGQNGYNRLYDLNGNGIIELTDFAKFADSWSLN
jgi:hypothetical protein